MLYFSQKSYKDKLGTCNTTISASGCYITSVCNLAKEMKTSLKDPKELNEYLTLNGGYTQGCLLNSAKAADYLGLIYKGRFDHTNAFPCIVETDHYKSKGFPQHFFVINSDYQILDPLDLEPKWKPNPYHIVNYRVFTKKEDLYKPQKEVESTTIAQEPQKTESGTEIPIRIVQSDDNVKNEVIIENNTMEQVKNSFDAVTVKKIGKGAAIAAVGAVITYLAQWVSSSDFGALTPLVVALSSIAVNAVREYLKGIPVN